MHTIILLNKAIFFMTGRYEDIIFETEAYAPLTTAAIRRAGAAKHKGIHRLKVYVASNDQSLNLEMDESYSLSVDAPSSTLSVKIPSACST